MDLLLVVRRRKSDCTKTWNQEDKQKSLVMGANSKCARKANPKCDFLKVFELTKPLFHDCHQVEFELTENIFEVSENFFAFVDSTNLSSRVTKIEQMSTWWTKSQL